MKKTFCLLMLLLPLSAAIAQVTYGPFEGVPDYYLVPSWYTQCPSYRTDTNFFTRGIFINDNNGITPNRITVREFHTDAPLSVYGMVALVAIDPFAYTPTPMQDPSAGRAPEYLMLLQGTDPILIYPGGDSTQAPYLNEFPHHMTVLDSLRWDTVTPSILHLPKQHGAVDDTDFFHCYAYECHFPAPVVVDSVFYVLGTYRSNHNPPGGFTHYPTVYFTIQEKGSVVCDPCETGETRVFSVGNFPNQLDFEWYRQDMGSAVFGYFYPLVNE